MSRWQCQGTAAVWEATNPPACHRPSWVRVCGCTGRGTTDRHQWELRPVFLFPARHLLPKRCRGQWSRESCPGAHGIRIRAHLAARLRAHRTWRWAQTCRTPTWLLSVKVAGGLVGTCAEGAEWLARASPSLTPARPISQASALLPSLGRGFRQGRVIPTARAGAGGTEGWVAGPRGQVTREAVGQGPPALGDPPPPFWCIGASGTSQPHPGTVCQLNRAFPLQQLGFGGAEGVLSASGSFRRVPEAMTHGIHPVKSHRESAPHRLDDPTVNRHWGLGASPLTGHLPAGPGALDPNRKSGSGP